MSSGIRPAERPRRYSQLLAAGVAFSLCSCGVAAWSQRRTSPANQAVREACAPDYHALCSGTRPGGGRVAACFEQNMSKLSEPCRTALQTAKAAKQ
jgi:hypothetical protein